MGSWGKYQPDSDKTGQQEVPGDKVDRSEDNKTGGGGDSIVGVQVCVFKREWCIVIRSKER